MRTAVKRASSLLPPVPHHLGHARVEDENFRGHVGSRNPRPVTSFLKSAPKFLLNRTEPPSPLPSSGGLIITQMIPETEKEAKQAQIPHIIFVLCSFRSTVRHPQGRPLSASLVTESSPGTGASSGRCPTSSHTEHAVALTESPELGQP